MNTEPEFFFVVDVKDVVGLIGGFVVMVVVVISWPIREWLRRRRELRKFMRDYDDF